MLRLIPAAVMDECRGRAAAVLAEGKPISRVGAAIVVGLWLAIAAVGVLLAVRFLSR